jgi:hypothetical protein
MKKTAIIVKHGHRQLMPMAKRTVTKLACYSFRIEKPP